MAAMFVSTLDLSAIGARLASTGEPLSAVTAALPEEMVEFICPRCRREGASPLRSGGDLVLMFHCAGCDYVMLYAPKKGRQ